MKHRAIGIVLSTAAFVIFAAGCGTMDEAKVRELARDEAQKALGMQDGAGPQKFGFGAAWEKEFSYSQ